MANERFKRDYDFNRKVSPRRVTIEPAPHEVSEEAIEVWVEMQFMPYHFGVEGVQDVLSTLERVKEREDVK